MRTLLLSTTSIPPGSRSSRYAYPDVEFYEANHSWNTLMARLIKIAAWRRVS
jgi:hypothetical protein